MDRRVVLAIVVGALCAVLFAAVATSATVRFAERGPQISVEQPPVTSPDVVAPTIPPERLEEPPSDAPPDGFPAVLVALLQIVAVAFILVIAVWAWLNRPRITWRRRTDDADDFDVLAEVAASVTADAAAQRRALLAGEPRNAIVECWLRLERLIVDAGITRRESDTSQELVERVLAASAVDPSAITGLSALYREARFSTHAMGEDARAAAIVALDSVHADLRAQVTASEETTVDREVDEEVGSS